MAAEVVTFDSNSLASVNGLIIIETDPITPAPVSSNIFELARANSSVLTSKFFKQRKIHVLVEIGRSSKALLEQSVRDLESILQGINKTLNFTQAGIPTDYYGATKTNMIMTDRKGGWAALDIEFTCTNPTGYATTATTLYNYSHLVGSAYSFAVTWDGNIEQQPVVTVTINSLLGGTNKTITIGNPTTTESCSIYRTWANSDILIVNSKTKSVTVNGTSVEYSGKIPEWKSTQPITYADDLTARDIAVNIVYQKRNV